MNISEANAVNRLLDYVLGKNKEFSTFRDSAIFLAERSDKALSAGWTADDVRKKLS